MEEVAFDLTFAECSIFHMWGRKEGESMACAPLHCLACPFCPHCPLFFFSPQSGWLSTCCLYLQEKVVTRQLPCSFFFFFFGLRTAPAAYRGSQARGRIGAVSTGLRHSQSHTRSEPCLWPTPQLTATPDPWPTEWGQGLACALMDTRQIRFLWATTGTPASLFWLIILSGHFPGNFFLIFHLLPPESYC